MTPEENKEQIQEEKIEETTEAPIEEPKDEVAQVKEKKSNPKFKVNKDAAKLKDTEVKTLAEDMKNAKTLMVVSIRNLPSAQLQKIKKQLREKAIVKVIKKNILLRAIDAAGVSEMMDLKEHIESDCALAISSDDAFELAAWLTENRNPIAAKIGQEATDDITVEPGPTDLMPGPDISILGSVGLKVSVEEGKIAIKEAHTILKKGEVVNENLASVLLKLDIKPFMIGLNPTVIYDGEAKEIYVGVKIDKEEALNNLLIAQSKGLGLAQSLKLVTKDTIGYLLAKANAEAMALEKLAPVEAKEEPAVAAEEGKEEAIAPKGVPSSEGKEAKEESAVAEEKPAENTETKSEEESK